MDKPLTGRQVLLGFLAFFGVVFLANGIMMWQAAATFDGRQEEDAYRKGRDYNATLAAARAQQDLGWDVTLEHKAWGAPTTRTVTARFTDAEGRPLSDLEVTATFFSPVEEEDDVTALLSPVGEGRYQAVMALPRAGNWELRLQAHGAGGVRYQLRDKTVVGS